jgi:hypothetical protein
LETGFKNIATRNQSAVLPVFLHGGQGTVAETDRRFMVDTTKDAWYYGKGREGAADIMGVLHGRNRKMRYTLLGEQFIDRSLTITAAPFKTAGQGFGVAPLYMDVPLK